METSLEDPSHKQHFGEMTAAHVRYRRFLFIFKLIGVHIDLNTSVKRPVYVARRIILILLMSVTALDLLRQVYWLYRRNSPKDYFRHIFFYNHIFFLSIGYVILMRSSQINQFVNTLVRLLNEYSSNYTEVMKKVKRWMYLCSFIAFFSFLNQWTYYIHKYVIPLIVSGREAIPPQDTEISFLLIYEEDKHTTINASFLPFLIVYAGLILFGDLVSVFLMYSCLHLSECYGQMNSKFKNDSDKNPSAFMRQHATMSNLVEQFNKIFSPTIMIIVVGQMLQIMTFTDDSIVEASSGFNHEAIKNIFRTIMYIAHFLTFATLGQRVKSRAQNGLNILLEAYCSRMMAEKVAKEENEIDHKENPVITLFTGQVTSVSVAITASGLFTIDYNLITIVISVALGYFTVVTTMNSTQNNDKIVDPECICNVFSSNFSESNSQIY